MNQLVILTFFFSRLLLTEAVHLMEKALLMAVNLRVTVVAHLTEKALHMAVNQAMVAVHLTAKVLLMAVNHMEK